MQPRKAVVAGQFYPAGRKDCIEQLGGCLRSASIPETPGERIVGGIVPHAGWTFSGPIAASVFSAIKKLCGKVDTFIIFGAAHSYLKSAPAIYDCGSWETPLGVIEIDEQLTAGLLKTKKAVSDSSAHRYEHSIEVQVPFIQHLFADAKLVPVITPPSKQAISLGYAVADLISAEKNKKIICLGSTDLTHYGPRYGFEPVGAGQEALIWAKDVNDKQFIDLAVELKPDELLESALENQNACGPAAAAAVVAVAKGLGKKRGVLLAHETSAEIMQRDMGVSSDDSVSYAAIVF